MEEDVKTFNDYVAVLRRRRAQFLWPLVLLLLISVMVAVALPPVYRSSATILIEQQDIPTDLVRSTVTSYAGERIQMISQRVMTTTNLGQIIQKFNLYEDERRRETTEEILESMREDIQLEMLSADVIDPKSGRPTQATIAFTLSYDNKSPELAQKVANELVSLYLNENIRTRARKAAETSGFLIDEAGKLRDEIAELEKKLAEFKERNVGQLPELVQLNLQLMERTERELMDTQREIRDREDRKIYLEAQLAQIHPNTSIVSATGETILGPADRLKALEAQYVSAAATYAPEHPDLIKMRKEMQALRKETGGSGDVDEMEKQLIKLRADLAQVREKYAADHPDVKKLQKMISALDEQRNNAPPESGQTKTALKPDNPAYIQLQAQLDAANTELKSFHEQKRELRKKLTSYEQRVTQTPQVEREYRSLTRDYDNALRKYQDIKAKQREAQLAEELEKGRKGERFSLIDPPLLPELPEKPNRIAIMFLGLVLSFAGGLGTVAVAESMDHAVRGVRGISAVFGAPPLAVIPYIVGERDERKRRRTNWMMFVVFLAGIGLALAAVHFLFKPLDVLWFIALRRLGI